jgi:hypothetical protein
MGVATQSQAPATVSRKRTPVQLVQEAGWAAVLVWTRLADINSLASSGDGTPDLPAFVNRCNDYDITAYVRHMHTRITGL